MPPKKDLIKTPTFDDEEAIDRLSIQQILDKGLIPDLVGLVMQYLYPPSHLPREEVLYEKELKSIGFERFWEIKKYRSGEKVYYIYQRIIANEFLKEPLKITVYDYCVIAINGHNIGSIRNHGMNTMRKTFNKCIRSYISRIADEINIF